MLFLSFFCNTPSTEIHTLSLHDALPISYLNNLMMVDFEKQNVDVARANLDLALERYELGVLSGLGFREFQLGYINRSEEHTSELQSRPHLVCRLLLENKKLPYWIYLAH